MRIPEEVDPQDTSYFRQWFPSCAFVSFVVDGFCFY
jgi:hypothetical protein